jgi:hypothetical protein
LQKQVFGLVTMGIAGRCARGRRIKKPVWGGPYCLTSGLVETGSADGLRVWQMRGPAHKFGVIRVTIAR